EAIALRLKLGAQLGIVVDAAIEGDGQAELGVGHGLARPFGQVDDPEPAMRERRVVMDDEAGAVRPPRRECLHHPGLGERRRRRAVEPYFSANATHESVGILSVTLHPRRVYYMSDN